MNNTYMAEKYKVYTFYRQSLEKGLTINSLPEGSELLSYIPRERIVWGFRGEVYTYSPLPKR